MTEPVPYDAFLAMEEQLTRERDEAIAELDAWIAAYEAHERTVVSVDEAMWLALLDDGGTISILPGVKAAVQGRYVMVRVAGMPVLRLDEQKIRHALEVLVATKRIIERRRG